jgi:hypothetical protein
VKRVVPDASGRKQPFGLAKNRFISSLAKDPITVQNKDSDAANSNPGIKRKIPRGWIGNRFDRIPTRLEDGRSLSG